jgi:hypothetical protein
MGIQTTFAAWLEFREAYRKRKTIENDDSGIEVKLFIR